MATRTGIAILRQMVDSHLQGIPDTTIPAADRDRAIREAVDRYGRDVPRRRAIEFAGDGGAYYLLHGRAIDLAETLRDAGIALLTASGPNTKLGIKFSLARRMAIREIGMPLQRAGETVAGEAFVEIYTDVTGLPVSLVMKSKEVDIDGDGGAPLGRYDWVAFSADEPEELPAGTYHAALAATGYTYAAGTSEIALGVKQGGSPVNDVSQFNSATAMWAAFGTASQGILRLTASTPGWQSTLGMPASVEYPAADVAADEQPVFLGEDQYEIYLTDVGSWLYFRVHRPAATELVRMLVADPYTWIEAPTPTIDIPGEHVTAIGYLAAAKTCLRVASKFGQKRSSTLNADVADRSRQGEFYRSLAKDLEKEYKLMLGLDKEAERKPGMTLVGMTPSQPAGGYLFHGRRRGGL